MYIIKLEYLLKYYTQYKPENQWFSVNSRAFSHVLFSYFRLSVNCCWKLRELEIDGVVCRKIEYVEKDYSSILIFIPVDSGVVTVCVYIEDDVVLDYILKSIAIE